MLLIAERQVSLLPMTEWGHCGLTLYFLPLGFPVINGCVTILGRGPWDRPLDKGETRAKKRKKPTVKAGTDSSPSSSKK